MKLTSDEKIRCKILVMDRHFLYLPLYLAEFDGPKFGKRPWFNKIPSKYLIEIARPPRESDRTDVAVFGHLMDARLRSSEIMFAACDPTAILERPDRSAMMAASIVASSAFWAVDHDADGVQLVSDLSSFDTILCYEPGTTSNLIARRIARRDVGKLRIVRSTDEIPQLEKLGAGTLALSPEILKITNLVYGELRPGEARAKIVLDLSTTNEFSNVLNTVLFTRAEVVEKHPDLVAGVLSALQSALIAIHAGHPMVKAAAEHNYRDAFHLDEALLIAANGNVFPETIHVRRDRWQRASEFYFISKAMAEGRDKTTLTKSEQTKAEEIYQASVLDARLQEITARSISSGFNDALETSDALSVARRIPRWMAAIMAIVVVGSFVIGLVYGATIGSAVAKFTVSAIWIASFLLGWLLSEQMGFRNRPFLNTWHWAVMFFGGWAIGEKIRLNVIPGAHFMPGYELGTDLATLILSIAVPWVFGLSFKRIIELRKQT